MDRSWANRFSASSRPGTPILTSKQALGAIYYGALAEVRAMPASIPSELFFVEARHGDHMISYRS
jgi:hypothetical protein